MIMDDLLIRMLRWSQKGYNCSQILFLQALEERGASNPELVRAVAGLAYGCGTGRATCGTLTGGCCLLAFLGGSDDQPAPEQLPVMLQELSDWFDTRIGQAQGGVACDAIVGDAGPTAARQTCGALISETYAKVMEILVEHGFYG
jgi:Putative redox-active protein (C_GCAxxG_C_C)